MNLTQIDYDFRYTPHRISLLREGDFEKLGPDCSPMSQALAALDTPVDMPQLPMFTRSQLVPPNPHLTAAHLQQQQLLQQQQMEQFQRFQAIQQQTAMAQQQALAAAQAQQIQQIQQRMPLGDESSSPAINGSQQMPAPNGGPAQIHTGRPLITKRPSSHNGGAMAPPNQPRQSLSPTNSLHPSQQLPMNDHSPQMVNSMMIANVKNGFLPNGQQLDPAQQRALQAKVALLNQTRQAAVHQLPTGMGGLMNGDQMSGVNPAEQIELLRAAQQAGFGQNVQAFLEARNKARAMTMKMSVAQQQQHQHQQQQQAQQQHLAMQQFQAQQQQVQANVTSSNNNGNGNSQQSYGSPALPAGQLQLKFPLHAAARLNASQAAQQRV